MNIEELKKQKLKNEEQQESNRRAQNSLEKEANFFESLFRKEKMLDEACLSLFKGRAEQAFFDFMYEERQLQEKELYQLIDENVEKLYQEKKKLENDLERLNKEAWINVNKVDTKRADT